MCLDQAPKPGEVVVVEGSCPELAAGVLMHQGRTGDGRLSGVFRFVLLTFLTF